MFKRLRRWAGRALMGPGPADDFWYQPVVSTTSAAGVNVTPTVAQQQATVATCVRVLGESMAYLPLFVFERQADGGRRLATEHRLHRTLHDQPNGWQTAFDFRELMLTHLCYRGNFFARILSGPRGAVDQLIPLHPAYMRKIQSIDGELYYTWEHSRDRANSGVYHQDEIFHVRNTSDDGIVGMTPIRAGANTIGLAIAAETHGASILRGGVQPRYVIKLPHGFGDDAAKAFAKSFSENFGGAKNSDKTPVLEEGAEPHVIGMTSEDAQLLETRKLQRSEIAGLFRVPAHMINDLEKATFSNITHLGIGFATYTLGPWCVRIRQAIERCLLTEPERKRYFVDFVLDAFVRGDIEKRSKAYALALDRWMKTNEIRKLENLNPIEGGDEMKEPVGGRGANQVPSTIPPGEPNDNGQPNQKGQANGTGILSRDLPGHVADPSAGGRADLDVSLCSR